MPRDANNRDNDGVEELKADLYSRSKQVGGVGDIRAPLSREAAEAPLAWQLSEDEKRRRDIGGTKFEERRRLPVARTFLFVSIGFFVVAAGAAAYIFLGGGNLISPQNIDMQIVAPSLSDGGKEAQFQIVITNRNQAPLQLADLIMTYPEGTRAPGDPTKNFPSERQSVGTIEPGAQVKLTSSAILFGESGTQKQIRAQLEYSVSGSNAVFEKDASTVVTLGSSPLTLSVEAPDSAISNQPFDVTLTVQSNSAAGVDNVVVEGQYPFGFSLTQANPAPEGGSTLWRLGTMKPGESKTIRLRGSLAGQQGEARVFRFSIGSQADQTDTHIKVPFLVIPHTLALEQPSVSASLSVDSQSGAKISTQAGKTLQGQVAWQNNSTEALQNVEVDLSFSGPALDKTSVQSGGFYNSQNSTIIWNATQDPNLSQVAPGGQGTLQFSFAAQSPGTGGVIYTNPTITLTLTVRGTSSSGTQAVLSAETMQVSLASAAAIVAQSFYKTGAYTNSGPTPPRAESPTSYTVVWTAKNSSNTLGNTAVSAVLPAYVQYVAGGSGVSYDSASRTVTWAVGDLKAGVGYTSAASSVSFQVIATPSASQVGTAPPLMGDVLLTGTDRFANVPVSAQTSGPTTATADGLSGVVVGK